MNNSNNQLQNNEPQCCVDYCENSFQVDGKEVVNTYKCNQKRFSIFDMWKVKKDKREFVRKSGL